MTKWLERWMLPARIAGFIGCSVVYFSLYKSLIDMMIHFF